jgi:hypothetical protein
MTDGIQSLSILGVNFSSHTNPTLILLDSIDFVLCRIREDLWVMEANSEQRAAHFNLDFDDCPVFDSYSDDLDDGPVFDADLNDGPVYDTDSDDLDHSSIIAARCSPRPAQALATLVCCSWRTNDQLPMVMLQLMCMITSAGI